MYYVIANIDGHLINPRIGGYKRESDAIKCVKRYGSGLVQYFKAGRLSYKRIFLAEIGRAHV